MVSSACASEQRNALPGADDCVSSLDLKKERWPAMSSNNAHTSITQGDVKEIIPVGAAAADYLGIGRVIILKCGHYRIVLAFYSSCYKILTSGANAKASS